MQEKFLYLLKNYYALVVFLAATAMFGIPDWSSFLVIITVFVFLSLYPTILFQTTDAFVFSLIAYLLLSIIWSNHTFRISYLGIRNEVVPILFYFIARSPYMEDDTFFDRFKWPLFIAFASGLYLFFFPPSWYLVYKYSSIDTSLENVLGDAGRLSGFWPWSYFIGYSSLFYIMYQTKKIIIDHVREKYDIALIVIAVACLLLAQQRVSIAFFLLHLIVLSIVAYRTQTINLRKLLLFWVSIVVIGVIGAWFAMRTLSEDFIYYALNRTVQNEDSLVQSRFGMFDGYLDTISLLGAGLGRYTHDVMRYNLDFIGDCDYIRILNEWGIIGFTLLAIVIFRVLRTASVAIERVYFEVAIVLFLCCSMIGAAPLSLGALQPQLYWFCIGHIVTKIGK